MKIDADGSLLINKVVEIATSGSAAKGGANALLAMT